MTTADVAAVADSWQLADGTPFPVPVTLDVPAGAVPADAGRLALADPEGTPLAVLQITERTPLGTRRLVRLAGPVTAQRVPEHGPFRRLMLHPGAGHAPRRPDGPRAGLGGPRRRCTAARSASSGTWPASSRPGCWSCPWSAARPRW